MAVAAPVVVVVGKPKPTSISLLSLRDRTASRRWWWSRSPRHALGPCCWIAWSGRCGVCSPKPNEASWARAGRARQHNADRQVRASTAAIAASSEGRTARVSNRWGGRRVRVRSPAKAVPPPGRLPLAPRNRRNAGQRPAPRTGGLAPTGRALPAPPVSGTHTHCHRGYAFPRYR